MSNDTTSGPVIGISGAGSSSAAVNAMIARIESAGGTSMFLGNHASRNAAEDLTKIDALVVMGNDFDVDPRRYGMTADTHTKVDTSPEGLARAVYQQEMIVGALQSGTPLMGVCAGMQEINVVCQGTLHQDVPSLVGHNEHAQQAFGIAPFTPVEPVTISAGTKLAEIAGGPKSVYAPQHGIKTEVNSMHHQSVDKAGIGLRVAATAADTLPDGSKLTEALEADPNGPFGKQFVLGVQWHPEFGANPLGTKLTETVVGEARQFARAHNRTHAAEEVREENIRSQTAPLKLYPPPEETLAEPLKIRRGSMTEMILSRRAQAGQSLGRAG